MFDFPPPINIVRKERKIKFSILISQVKVTAVAGRV